MFKSRKSPPKQTVQCPSCRHTQWEYAAAVATHCHTCGTRIPIQEKTREGRLVRLKVERKEIDCHHCNRPLVIPAEALSWQCPGCSSYLDFKDHVLDRETSSSIETYGTLTVGPKGVAAGVRTSAVSAEIAGRILGRLTCVEKVRLSGEARLHGHLEAEEVVVAPGARVDVAQLIETPLIRVDGRLKATEILASHVVVGPEGDLAADVVRCFSIQVEKCGRLRARLETRDKPAPPPVEPEPVPPSPEEEDPLAEYLK
ncbi:MAG: polymer-forming cytoskeletal protein [Candidatus Methylacidiphilales bacterium]|nr:polymer-forming cytoskeletal protein [Candidatus Methylacidiphilales bacterium]